MLILTRFVVFSITCLVLLLNYTYPVFAGECKTEFQKRLSKLFRTKLPKKVCIMPAVPMVEASEGNKKFNFSKSKRLNLFLYNVSASVNGDYKLLGLKKPKTCQDMGWIKKYDEDTYLKCLQAYKNYRLPSICGEKQTFIIGGLIPESEKTPKILILDWTSKNHFDAAVKRVNNLSSLAKNFAKVINTEVKKLTKCN